jgi:hypothetical protein
MNALDKLGLAIANAGYTWTPEMREAYENGVKEFETIRAEALEEAAKVCEDYDMDHIVGQQLAAAIRGLK